MFGLKLVDFSSKLSVEILSPFTDCLPSYEIIASKIILHGFPSLLGSEKVRDYSPVMSMAGLCILTALLGFQVYKKTIEPAGGAGKSEAFKEDRSTKVDITICEGLLLKPIRIVRESPHREIFFHPFVEKLYDLPSEHISEVELAKLLHKYYKPSLGKLRRYNEEQKRLFNKGSSIMWLKIAPSPETAILSSAGEGCCFGCSLAMLSFLLSEPDVPENGLEIKKFLASCYYPEQFYIQAFHNLQYTLSDLGVYSHFHKSNLSEEVVSDQLFRSSLEFLLQDYFCSSVTIHEEERVETLTSLLKLTNLGAKGLNSQFLLSFVNPKSERDKHAMTVFFREKTEKFFIREFQCLLEFASKEKLVNYLTSYRIHNEYSLCRCFNIRKIESKKELVPTRSGLEGLKPLFNFFR